MKYFYFLILLLLSFNLHSQDHDNLDAAGTNFFNGVLIKNAIGKKQLVVGDNILKRHEYLLGKIAGSIEVLWLGELKVVDGQVTEVNETAGAIPEKYQFLKQKGLGRKNIEAFLNNEGYLLKEKHFRNTKYTDYDDNNRHLDEKLIYISYFRHDLGEDLGKIISVTTGGSATLENAKEAIERLTTAYDALISIIPALDNKEWRDIKPYLIQIQQGKLPSSASRKKAYAAYMAFGDFRRKAFSGKEDDYTIYTGSNKYKAFVTKVLKSVTGIFRPTDNQVLNNVHTEGLDFLERFDEGVFTGLEVKTKTGQIITRFGTILANHLSMYYDIKEQFGEIESILWGGELETKKVNGKIKILQINENCGLKEKHSDWFDPNASVENIYNLLKNSKQTQDMVSTKPKLVKYDENINYRSITGMSGIELKKFRHEIKKNIDFVIQYLEEVEEYGYEAGLRYFVSPTVSPKLSEMYKTLQSSPFYSWVGLSPTEGALFSHLYNLAVLKKEELSKEERTRLLELCNSIKKQEQQCFEFSYIPNDLSGKNNVIQGFLPKGKSFSNEQLKGGAEESNGDFVDPNETNPVIAKPIFDKVGKGVYISVGTERGFIAASMAKATHLLLIDKDPPVVLYNRTKIGLISISTDMDDLRYLVLTAPHEEWVKRVNEYTGSMSEEVRSALTSDATYLSFIKITRANKLSHMRDLLNSYGEGLDFYGANYHFDKTQYEKLKSMADKGNISAELVDLADSELLAKIAENIKAKGLSIAAVDLSNSWNYLDNLFILLHVRRAYKEPSLYNAQPFVNMINALKESMNANSILVLTNNHIKTITGDFRGNFSYLSFYMDYIIAHLDVINELPNIMERDIEWSNPATISPDIFPSASKKIGPIILATIVSSQKKGEQGFLPQDKVVINTQLKEMSDKKFYSVSPNELQPQNAQPIFDKIKDGVYISVGTERGFIAASLTGASHLLLVDLDPPVVLYNRIKIGLISISKDMEDLRHLILDAPYEEWSERVNKYEGYLDAEVRKAVDDKELYVFFTGVTRNAQDKDLNMYDLLHQRNAKFFNDANYHFYKEQYDKLKSMTEKGNISAQLVDITDSKLMGEIAENIKLRGLSIGALDISNAWGYTWYKNSLFIDKDPTKRGEKPFDLDYDPKYFEQMVSVLKPALSEESLLILTGVNNQGFHSYLSLDFSYLMMNSSNIKILPNIIFYLQSVNPDYDRKEVSLGLRNKILDMKWNEQTVIINPDLFGLNIPVPFTKTESKKLTPEIKDDSTEDADSDVRSILLNYVSESADTDQKIVKKTIYMLEEDLKTNGGVFSSKASSLLIRKGVADFISKTFPNNDLSGLITLVDIVVKVSPGSPDYKPDEFKDDYIKLKSEELRIKFEEVKLLLK